MKIQYTAFSETGSVRKENQDSLFCQTDGMAGLFVVADGMGGHEDGAYASRQIKEHASKWWNRYQQPGRRSDFLENVQELKEVFNAANRKIYGHAGEGGICGSTLAALWLEENAWALLSCGDSRCYQARGGIFNRKFFRMAADDVWENQPDNIRGMSRQEIESNKNYGCLVRAVGVQPELSCSIQCNQLRERTLFLLCSDGIHKYCPDKLLKRLSFFSLRSSKLKPAAEDIRRQVFQNGAGDNLTLILVMAGV